MLFNTVEYWLFFLVVVAVFYSLPFRAGKIFVLLASYYFYMRWDPRFIALILASTIIDYTLGILLESAEGKRRKLLLVISLVVNLGILGFFKYYNFFASSLAVLLSMPENSFALRIILPVGVSFYTFASLSYTIDVYWRRMKAVRSFIDYAFFVAFFPHLLAGPIIRARQFISQIELWKRPPAFVIQRGIALILSGLVKKMVFGDQFALVSDAYFGHLSKHPGWLAAWSGGLAFAMQIFFDFSGYTDIARGCAKLLGFEFPLNFVRPYLARNVAEFWQRWHITLFHWLRDYLFIPLNRGRKGELAVSRNLMITMLLAGLWHGASWNFILWGAYNGVRLIGHRLFRQAVAGTALGRIWAMRCFVPVQVLLAAMLSITGVVLFRAPTLQDARTVYAQMFNPFGIAGENLLTLGPLFLFFLSLILAAMEERKRVIERMALAPVWIQVPAYACVFFSLELFSVTEQTIPFIYFQF